MKIQIQFSSNPDVDHPCCAETTYRGNKVFGIGKTWQVAQQRLVDKINAMESMNPIPNPALIEVTLPAPPTPPKRGRGVGLFYLDPAWKIPDVYHDPAVSIGNTNADMQGVMWRMTWKILDAAGRGNHNWVYYDAAFDAAQTHNKLMHVEILGGDAQQSPPAGTPDWFYALPKAAKLTLPSSGIETTVPWDPVLQNEIRTVMVDFIARYSSHPAWPKLNSVKIWQVGRGSESFLVPSLDPADMAAANALAQSAAYSWTPYADAHVAWVAGVKKLIDIFAQLFIPQRINFSLVTGVPFAIGGDVDLTTCFNYGTTKYPGKFGIRADDLYTNKPKPGDLSYDVLKAYVPFGLVGFQEGRAVSNGDPNPPNNLQLASNIALDGVGVHYIEYFPDDANDPTSHPVLVDNYNKILAQ